MTGAEYLVDCLIKNGVTDVFGIPGGAVLEFLYALDARLDKVRVHLSCHEQCAAFAAEGYAQACGRPGAAYATKGPGITNMLTPIADAYSDSTPLLAITAHTVKQNDNRTRFIAEQELDTVKIFGPVTKFAVKIESIETLAIDIDTAIHIALSGRKGPVLIDVLDELWSQEIITQRINLGNKCSKGISKAAVFIAEKLRKSKRPLFLAGDGIHQAREESVFNRVAEKLNVPVLSSRSAVDIMPKSHLYYGYVGSHGIRYANFALSKADLIIAIGNRLSFPTESESFKHVYDHAEILWIDYDRNELTRTIPNCTCFHEDMRDTLRTLADMGELKVDNSRWLSLCAHLRDELNTYDQNLPVLKIKEIFQHISPKTIIVNDVGNNEFWSSRAYLASGIENRMLFSKSFGAMGCALAKSIGVHYATGRPVLCVTGDQGLQLNSQELQVIGKQKLPIAIILVNNNSSGMIRSRQLKRYDGRFLHTTQQSGYSAPSFKSLARAYGVNWYPCSSDSLELLARLDGPLLIEVEIPEEEDVEPYLLQGDFCDHLSPLLEESLYEVLHAL